ncbi:MAG: hypothetical protein ACW98F_18995, partial [Candidatus Hodarchaeales archaeon]
MQKIYPMFMSALSAIGLKRIWYWKEVLEKEGKKTREEIGPIIEKRARALLTTLNDNRFYSEFFPEGAVTDENPVKTLTKFPILKKETIRANFRKGLLSVMPRVRIRLDSTSGSTGVPLQFAKDMQAEDIKLATEIMFSEYTGWRFGQKQAYLWAEHKESKIAKLWKRYIQRLKQFPPYYSSSSSAENALCNLKKWQPELLTGYSSALYSFSQHFETTNILPNLKGIIASAEALYPYQKLAIEEKFGSRVYMRYGSRELDNIAMECSERNGYHILQSRYIVEIVDDNGTAVEEEEIG